MAVAEASSSGGGGEEGYGAWTREQEKAFENAIATMAEEADGDARWEKIAEAIEGKTADEVRQHYELLVEDIEGIDAGRVPLPTYAVDGGAEEGGGGGGGKKGGGGGGAHGEKGSAKSAEQERRKGIAWTEDEHRLTSSSSFLLRTITEIVNWLPNCLCFRLGENC